MDVNPWCVKAASENLEWVEREYGLERCRFSGSARRCRQVGGEDWAGNG